MHLREERRERILSADPVPLALDQVVPLAVMDVPVSAPARAQDLQGNLLQPLPAQPWRQTLDTQLSRQPKDRAELTKQMLVACRLVFELLRKGPKTVSLLALLRHARGELIELCSQMVAQRVFVASTFTH